MPLALSTFVMNMRARAFWMESWPDCLGYLEGATCMAEQPEVQTRRLMSHSGEHPGLSSGQPY